MKRVFVDSGGFFAHLVAEDAWHERARSGQVRGTHSEGEESIRSKRGTVAIGASKLERWAVPTQRMLPLSDSQR